MYKLSPVGRKWRGHYVARSLCVTDILIIAVYSNPNPYNGVNITFKVDHDLIPGSHTVACSTVLFNNLQPYRQAACVRASSSGLSAS